MLREFGDTWYNYQEKQKQKILDGSIRWINLAAEYIFRSDDISEIGIKKINLEENEVSKDLIAQSYSTPVEVRLREIEFFMKTRVHLIPSESSKDFMLVEVLCNSRLGLEALRQTISCIEYDRIDLAYQKQYDLKTGQITGVEALLRLRDEEGQIIPNDVIIPEIEGESLFSLVVKSSLEKLKEIFAIKSEIGLENATIYLNVSAHTIMHPEFSSIFSNFVALFITVFEISSNFKSNSDLLTSDFGRVFANSISLLNI